LSSFLKYEYSNSNKILERKEKSELVSEKKETPKKETKSSSRKKK
jgi:hypothetical protein